MKTLRPYQQAAVDSILDWYKTHKANEFPLVVAPVGAGKSLIIAALIKLMQFPKRTKVVVLTHVKELLDQNHGELRGFFPDVDAGFYCAGLGQKRLGNDVTFASIQSICKKALLFPKAPQVIIIDECHLISRNENTQYLAFIKACQELNPNLVVIGLTGTPFRADSGRLDDGEDRLFFGVAYEIPIKYMIDEGYLVRPTTKLDKILDATGVHTSHGDYKQGELERAVNKEELTKHCVSRMIEVGKDRKKWIVFTAGLEHCENVYKELLAQGADARMLTSKTGKEERKQILLDYKAGKFKALVNVAVLTTGFNEPSIDMLVNMRPMKSIVLYIQVIGRGIRTLYADGYDLSTREGRLEAIANSSKKDCLVLDFGGTVDALGAIDDIEIRSKKPKVKSEDDEVGKPIMKRCPSCGTECAGAQRYCYNCSYSFIDEKLSGQESDAAILKEDYPILCHKVIKMITSIHESKQEGKPPTLQVEYITMAGVFKEWLCFDHPIDSFPWRKAIAWFRRNIPGTPLPESVFDANTYMYRIPEYVYVQKEGKFFKVRQVDYPEHNDCPF